MVQYQSPIRIYKKPFELVMAAYEKRFPTSPLIPVFLGSEILSEYKSEDGAIHMIERRCKLAVDAPGWFKKVLGIDFVYFIQKNTLNYRDRSLVIEARNESFANKVSIVETCNYKVHPENSEWTAFDQEANLKIKSFLGLESAVEKFAMKNYLKNVDKGKEIIEHYLAELEKEGVHYIAPWKGPADSSSSSSSSSSASSDSKSAPAKVAEEEAVTAPKLDADYMKRYLGDLTTMEESEFTQLRTKVISFCKKSQYPLPEDSTILRFLKAREFNSEKAFEMISRSLYWRQAEGADEVLTNWEQPEVLADYLPGGWHRTDVNGHPVFILRIGPLDVKGLLRSVTEEDLMKQIVYINEIGMKLAKEATEKNGKPVSDFTCICDFEGLGLKHLWRPGISVFQKLITQDTANYPETMNKLLVVRAPLLFPVAWSIVRNVFDERTRNKIVVLGDNYLEQLSTYIPTENIPTFLGGTCPTEFSSGGTVPKSFYLDPALSDESETSSLSSDLTSMYKETTIGRGSTFRIPFEVKEADTVITWDFFVHSGADVGFGIFHSSEVVDIDAHASDLAEVEKTQRYKDSVQGTYVCTRPGLYVLRWDNTYSWVTSKTLSYHADLIGSELYRRSLSSLLSVSTSASLNSIDTTETSTSTNAN